ncbi:MAG: hypothetical protein CLLPBCKN_006839 [Chroococcidiopsis cubana SAG 39.79]|nr:hypothetical protein [Chroococcidiopsis cubana SAG 39.79]
MGWKPRASSTALHFAQFSLEYWSFSESSMYLTQKNQIRGLEVREFKALQELCRLSKNLYNVGLYSVRQFFFAESRYLRYESNYHQCKGNENYKLLNTDIAQQTLKVVDRYFPLLF